MSGTVSAHGFHFVRHGYDHQQVDHRVAELLSDRDAALRRIGVLEQRIEVAHLGGRDGQGQPIAAEPSYAGLGARVEQILRGAEEDATGLREQARLAADQSRQIAGQAGGSARADAERFVQERTAKADTDATRILSQAREQATARHRQAEKEAAAKREEAQLLFEQTRAKAAQSAATFETSLATRRDRAERDLASRQGTADKRLAEIERLAEKLRADAERLRAEADHRSRHVVEAAQRQADQVVLDARSRFEGLRTESERELNALTHRRDSINAHLTNVREMLATSNDDMPPNAGAQIRP